MSVEVRHPHHPAHLHRRREGRRGRGRDALRADRATSRATTPACKDRLVEPGTGPGDLRRFVNVYVNDEDVRFTGGLETKVEDGDQVVVCPAVAGGAS